MKNSIRNQIPHAIGWALMFHDHLENLAEGMENGNDLVFLSGCVIVFNTSPNDNVFYMVPEPE
jgi:hypothetical protein